MRLSSSVSVSLFLPLFAVVMLGPGCSKPPASVELDPVRINLSEKGKSATLAATVKDAAGNPLTVPVTWESADPKVATVDATGMVASVASGSTTVKATAGKVSATADVEVAIPTKIQVEPADILLHGPGQTAAITAAVMNELGGPIDTAVVKWASDDVAVATVTDGNVAAVADGMTTVRATCGAATASIAVTVRSPQPTTITVDRPSLTVKIGKSDTLAAIVLDDTGTAMTPPPVTWSSANPAVATVDAAGVVTGVKRGDTTVMATAGAVTANVAVRVR